MAWKRKNLQKIFAIFLLLFNKRSDFIVFIFVQNKTTPTKMRELQKKSVFQFANQMQRSFLIASTLSLAVLTAPS